jgi:hypothetical protein
MVPLLFVRAVFMLAIVTAAGIVAAQERAIVKSGAQKTASSAMRPIADQSARRWTAADDGRQTVATLIAASETAARFQKADGRMASIALSKLSPADAAYIDAAFRAAGGPRMREPSRRPATRLVVDQRRGSDNREDHAKNNGKKTPAWLEALTGPKLPTAADLRDFIARRQAASSASSRPLPANVIYVRFSQEFLRQYMHRDLHNDAPVDDDILGTPIQGTAHYAATARLELVPNDDHAVMRLHLVGTVHSNTVGYNGPVRIHSTGETQFASTKLLSTDGRGMEAGHAVTLAETHSQTQCIDTDVPGLRGRIVRRVASRRVDASRGDADIVAARHTEARINRRFDESVKERLESMAKGLRGPFGIFAANAADPEAARNRLYATTTAEYLQLMMLSRDADKKDFVPEPARLAQRPEIEVHIHSTVMARALDEMQWRMILKPVLNTLLAQRAIRGGTQTASGMQTEWRLQYSEGAQWVTLVWNSEPAALARAKPPATGSAAHVAASR